MYVFFELLNANLECLEKFSSMKLLQKNCINFNKKQKHNYFQNTSEVTLLIFH